MALHRPRPTKRKTAKENTTGNRERSQPAVRRVLHAEGTVVAVATADRTTGTRPRRAPVDVAVFVARVLQHRVLVAQVPDAHGARAVPRVRVPGGHVLAQLVPAPEQPAAQLARARPPPVAVAGAIQRAGRPQVVHPVRERGRHRGEPAAAPVHAARQPVVVVVVHRARVPPQRRLAVELERAQLAVLPPHGHRLRQRLVRVVGAHRQTVLVRPRCPPGVQERRLRGNENRKTESRLATLSIRVFWVFGRGRPFFSRYV